MNIGNALTQIRKAYTYTHVHLRLSQPREFPRISTRHVSRCWLCLLHIEIT